MAFDLTGYLTRHGTHVVPTNLIKEITEATGYVGLHIDPARCPEGRVREMSERLKQRFANLVPKKSWCAVKPAYYGAALTLPTMLLMELGLMALPLDLFVPEVMRKYADIIHVGPVGIEFVNLIYELDAHAPPEQMIPTIALWLMKLQQGLPTTVVMTVCPDYSHDNGSYNFQQLWDGVGLVAQRALRASVLLYTLQQRTGTRLRIVVAIADFEGDSENVCTRLGITQTEFKARCQRSQIAFRAEAEKASPGIEKILETPLWSHIVKREEWSSVLVRTCESVARNELSGFFHLKPGDLNGMAKMRHGMYKRWHGEDCDPVAIILRQAPEYGAVGALVAKHFANPLVLGADHVAMSPFLHMLLRQLLPVVYMKKADY